MPDPVWGRNTAPWILSQLVKPSRMDTMAQFTPSHMILIIVPCRAYGVNITRNVAPRGIFCIFVPTFGQYVKSRVLVRAAHKTALYQPRHTILLFSFLQSSDRYIHLIR